MWGLSHNLAQGHVAVLYFGFMQIRHVFSAMLIIALASFGTLSIAPNANAAPADIPYTPSPSTYDFGTTSGAFTLSTSNATVSQVDILTFQIYAMSGGTKYNWLPTNATGCTGVNPCDITTFGVTTLKIGGVDFTSVAKGYFISNVLLNITLPNNADPTKHAAEGPVEISFSPGSFNIPTTPIYDYTALFTYLSYGNLANKGGGLGIAQYGTAHFIKPSVTFNANGGAGSMSVQTAGSALTANTFTRLGYSFYEWNATPQSPWTTDSPVVAGYDDENSWTFDGSQPAQLYARWKANTYTLNFNTQGRSSVDADSYVSDGTITLPESPTRPGFKFAGWFTEATGGTKLENSFTATATGEPLTLLVLALGAGMVAAQRIMRRLTL